MTAAETLVLERTWPLWEQPRRFDLGHVLNSVITEAIEPAEIGGLGSHHAGVWECDLAGDRLIWSGGVYDIFGLARGSALSREQAIAHYSEESRAKMERLRTYAIRHKRGFTLDVEIRAAAVGDIRQMRLIAAPVCEAGAVVRLHGLKLII